MVQRDYSKLTEETLFNAYCGGDMQAFETLLRRCKNLVYSLILRYVRSAALADEIFQDVFFKVCKNKDLFREAVSFKAWLVTITKNTCIDHTRKQVRALKTVSLDEGSEDDDRGLGETLDSGQPNPEENLNWHVEDKELAGLLDRLPVEQKETFYLKIVMELTFEEIGESMKCSPNTAKSRFRYALEALRGLVNRKTMIEDLKLKNVK